jgi:hypothetical protein
MCRRYTHLLTWLQLTQLITVFRNKFKSLDHPLIHRMRNCRHSRYPIQTNHSRYPIQTNAVGERVGETI